MKNAKSVVTLLALFGFCLLFAPTSLADRTITDRGLSAFWAQFDSGDSSVNVYSALDKLILNTEDQERRATLLMWDGSHFSLFLRGNEITDLVTGQDSAGRPTFQGSFDSNCEPLVKGVVDITPDGNRVVNIYESPEVVNARWETAPDGHLVARATCECSAVYVNFVCESKHCGWNPPPVCSTNGTTTCAWLTVALNQPPP